jgi:uncharacterized repeat protein (TIGR03803 family)
MIKTIYYFLLAASCCFLVILRTEAGGSETENSELNTTYLTNPANNCTTANISQKCLAKSVANATAYTFQFCVLQDFSSNVLTFDSNTNSTAVSGLNYATKYFARVKTNVNESFGTVTSFITKSSEQYAFVSKPGSGTIGNDAAQLKVTANSVYGAKRYTIELNTSQDFSGVSFIVTSMLDYQRTLVLRGLAYSTKYYARVKTDISDVYGKVTSFTTRAEQFSFVSEPGNNSNDNNYSIMKVVVAPVHQAKRYMIELSASPDFSNAIIKNESLTDLQRTFVFQKLKPKTTYYARAKTDVSTDYGKIITFTTRESLKKHRLWGVTTSGGVNGAGTVFSFSLDSLTFIKHHENTSTEYLHGSLTPAPDGTFFGMGIQYSTGDAGEIYKIDNRGNYSVVYNNGGIHFGGLMLASNNQLYVVDDWINSFRGGIRKLNPDGSDLDVATSIFHKFRSDSDGKNPIAPVVELDKYLYGMAPSGGLYKKGVIYKKKIDGSFFQVLHHFNGATGASPQGSLIAGIDGYLYGLTFSGGINNYGTIFKIKSDGSDFTKLFDFNGTSGKYPFGDLVESGNFFYGMTSEGGTYDNGIVFKISPTGVFTKLFDFAGADGAIPLGSLSVDDAGAFYGMTANGGVNDLGVIFKIKNDGTGFTKLYDFSTGGGNPDGSPVIVEDTFGSDNAARMLTSIEQSIQPAYEDQTTRFYPNPFVNTMTVEVASVEETFSVTLTDLSGRVVLEEKANHIVQIGGGLAQGVYIAKVTSGNRIIQQRVMKR